MKIYYKKRVSAKSKTKAFVSLKPSVGAILINVKPRCGETLKEAAARMIFPNDPRPLDGDLFYGDFRDRKWASFTLRGNFCGDNRFVQDFSGGEGDLAIHFAKILLFHGAFDVVLMGLEITEEGIRFEEAATFTEEEKMIAG
jgi:hypothetical protein